MAGFRITKPYTMSEKQVRKAAEGLAKELEREHGVHSRWEGNTVYITGAGIDGQMCYDHGRIDVSVKLGLLASIFEGVLRREVNSYLDAHVS